MLSSFVQQLLSRNQELIDFLQSVIVARLDAMDERLIVIVREQKQVQQVCERIVNGD